MSFGEKLTAMMQRPGEDLVAKDDVPWWMKYSGRGLGTVGGGLAIIIGLFSAITSILSITDMLSSICLILAGFIVLVIEAPCCCFFIDFVQTFSDTVEKRPYWNRAAFYCVIAIVPIFLDFTFSKFFGSGLIFATGLIYGMMAVGKKASFHEMRTSAAAVSTSQTSASTSTKSNLVQNAQPPSFTNPPDNIV